ncbi:MAG: HAD family hydrolase [Candidatus Zixiibacteriota bacterium]|nr:MAG: HAD family hydrolase [candidate division Zixibacteria bacterium]
MIDTVTFDLWNTLISNVPQDYHKYRQRRIKNLARVLRQDGREVESGLLTEAYSKGFETCTRTWEKNLDLSTEEQLKIMFGFLDDQGLQHLPRTLMPRLVEAYVSPILEDPPCLIDGAKEILVHAKGKGYKVGLICNTGTTPGQTIRVLLERLEMVDLFDVTTFSNELGIRKPDPRIFLRTLRELRSKPENSAHVGDLIDVDVLGAKNVGMISVHYNPELIPSGDIGPDMAITELRELRLILTGSE